MPPSPAASSLAAAAVLVPAVLVPALLAAGCGLVRDEMAGRFDAAAREGRAARGTIAGRPVAVLVEECRVYDLATRPGLTGRREPVLTTEFYPWFTMCERQHAALDTGHVVVTLGRTAFGAGGCCAAGGTYRSRDGRRWERARRDGGWEPVDAPDAATVVRSDSAGADATGADATGADATGADATGADATGADSAGARGE